MERRDLLKLFGLSPLMGLGNRESKAQALPPSALENPDSRSPIKWIEPDDPRKWHRVEFKYAHSADNVVFLCSEIVITEHDDSRWRPRYAGDLIGFREKEPKRYDIAFYVEHSTGGELIDFVKDEFEIHLSNKDQPDQHYVLSGCHNLDYTQDLKAAYYVLSGIYVKSFIRVTAG